MFSHNPTHWVVVCHVCRSCIIPGRDSQKRHLRAEPHRLLGDVLSTTIELLSSYNLRSIRELKEHKPRPTDQCQAIEHLASYDGFYCLQSDCRYCTRHLPKMKKHMVSAHRIKAKEHGINPLWKECKLQTYFTGHGRIDYFVITDEKEKGGISEQASHSLLLTQPEKELFEKLEKDYKDVKGDLKEQATIVQDIGDSRSERVPWLHDVIRSPSHLITLKDKEIWSSYKLPPKKELDASSENTADPNLVRILVAAEAVLRDAYRLCSDTSPDRKMTQQRANILNEFYTGASGKADGFPYFKNASTLVMYFTTIKQLLVYYYRVVYNEDGHFTRSKPDQVLPKDVIQPTALQIQAMDEIMKALDLKDGEEAELALKYAIRRLYLALICHTVGSVPFKSPVLSFCAMLSRKVRGKGQGLWEEPGNFNSHLSALTWTAQLVLFDYACFQEQDDEDQIPVFLAKICKKFFQQLAETPFGHILQWRLYLFKVGKAAITKHQARWFLDGQTVEYRGVELQMSQISDLVVSEYQQAHALLYDELLFQANDLTPMESWRLKDDLDLEDFGGSWLSHPSNTEFLEGTELALFRRIQGNTELRAMFLIKAKDGSMILCPNAMAIYEAHAQDFLKRALVLCHIPGGPPLRASELLSVMWCNTARQRHMLIWEKLVMIYVQYHKGQQQSGAYKDNIRFLPKAIGDLLLSYVAYVLPLRQLFLRQQSPGALISPYLWAKLDGTVWADETLSACLTKACSRAKVPRLHTSNWRQFTASITKEKFSVKERANFDLEEDIGEEIEDELDLIALAELSNHSYHTFNYAYAGTTTLTMNTLLHRNYRASESWRTFFRFDHILQGKRPRGASETLSLRMLDASKRSQMRRRGAYSEANLLAVARKLYNAPDLQFRVPGQRNGVLAVMGPQPAEQVVLVIGTGSGKTMVVMIGAAVADAGTTILILPMVALRGDMLRRFHEVGIRPLVWSVGCKKSASLVIVSAEAACTQGFLEYCHIQVSKQELARIVVDECHLTITTSNYRPCMAQLGWYIRQVRTQTVWLTATLPPVIQEEFIEYNKLVKPRIIRESTNRPNIKYLVSLETGPGALIERAANLVQAYWPKQEIFNHSRDKIIVYCRTREEVAQLADTLKCPSYTSKSGTEDEKAVIISGWLGNRDQPVIVATSALGIGFDYPYVRWVIHVDAPDKATSFSQESGRAGRDGKKASSIIMLSATWKPQVDQGLSPDKEAMQLYLTQQYCSRGVLSQFLDDQPHWRWCMPGEEVCQVCQESHMEDRPLGLKFELAARGGMEFTGPDEVLRQDHVRDQVLDSYERDLEVMLGSCLYCRILSRKFDHAAGACPRRFQWIHAKNEAYQTRKREKKEWIQRYMACWNCYQPQDICRVADPEHEETECQFPDIVMPLCYGVWKRSGGSDWLQKHFERTFQTELEYMYWLGETASLGGNECIQANCVAALALAELG
jgi:orsellinic acid/F9775 biosynthesis protein OrsD/helicase-like protein/RAD3-like DEAD/DEAH box helicase